jgi:hypothetical protein
MVIYLVLLTFVATHQRKMNFFFNLLLQNLEDKRKKTIFAASKCMF